MGCILLKIVLNGKPGGLLKSSSKNKKTKFVLKIINQFIIFNVFKKKKKLEIFFFQKKTIFVCLYKIKTLHIIIRFMKKKKILDWIK